MKLNVLHIHTDIKFLHATKLFEGEHFTNEIVLIAHEAKAGLNMKLDIIPPAVRKIDLLIEKCNKFDVVVLHGLCKIKRRIALGIAPKTVICWRFFGYELHKLNRTFSYSDLTKRALAESRISRIGNFVNSSISKFKSFLKWQNYLETDLLRTIDRINYFICWSDEEYRSLHKYVTRLPQMVKLPLLLQSKIDTTSSENKKKKIIVGNNRAAVNNHLDIIKLIRATKSQDQYSLVFPFSYGNQKSYIRKLKAVLSTLENVETIESFMSRDEYQKIYEDAAALVINYYSQGALGNIFFAIENNVKVYLNKKNCVYDWLTNLGLLIYSIDEQLKDDLENDNVRLTEEEIIHNHKMVSKIKQDYSVELFQSQLYRTILDKFKKRQLDNRSSSIDI